MLGHFRIGLLPFLASLIVSTIYLLLSLLFRDATSPPIGQTLRDSFFVLLLSQILGLMIRIVYKFSSSDSGPRLRAIFADQTSVDCLNLIEDAMNKCTKRSSFMMNRLHESVDKFVSGLKPLSEGIYECKPDEIVGRTRELYSLAKTRIQAVSLIDINEYWRSQKYGPHAILQNQDARRRGVRIERVFVFRYAADVIRNLRILQELKRMGVKLRCVYLSTLQDKLRRDFSLYDDDSYVQYFEFLHPDKETEYKNCTVSTTKEDIDRYSRTYRNIHQLSQVLDPDDEKKWRSLWSSDEFRRFSEGSPPELHLESMSCSLKSVLDIGCGAGRSLAPLTKVQDCQITGIDYDMTAARLCREKYSAVRVVEDTFKKGSFDGEQFDAIIAYNSIYHNTREGMFSALEQAYSILKPGGYLLITLKTVVGNEEAIPPTAIQVAPNTWYLLEFPDFWEIHHFSSPDEINQVFERYEIVHESEIPLKREGGVIVQGAGKYFIAQKKMQ